jgi:hypothetical protein
MLKVAKSVDDLSLKVSGVAEQVVSTAKEVTTWMCTHLKEKLDTQVSLDNADGQRKTVALATRMWLIMNLEAPFAKLGIKFESRAENLGLDQYGAGMIKDRGKTARSKRLFACVARAGRLRYAGARGAKVRKVAVAGLCPAAKYGHKALGVLPGLVQTNAQCGRRLGAWAAPRQIQDAAARHVLWRPRCRLADGSGAHLGGLRLGPDGASQYTAEGLAEAIVQTGRQTVMESCTPACRRCLPQLQRGKAVMAGVECSHDQPVQDVPC